MNNFKNGPWRFGVERLEVVYKSASSPSSCSSSLLSSSSFCFIVRVYRRASYQLCVLSSGPSGVWMCPGVWGREGCINSVTQKMWWRLGLFDEDLAPEICSEEGLKCVMRGRERGEGGGGEWGG